MWTSFYEINGHKRIHKHFVVLELQRQKKEIKDLYFLVSALHDMLWYKKATTFVLKRKVPFIQKMNSALLTLSISNFLKIDFTIRDPAFYVVFNKFCSR